YLFHLTSFYYFLYVFLLSFFLFFFFNDTATTEIYTLSLHDALPISLLASRRAGAYARITTTSSQETWLATSRAPRWGMRPVAERSEEHTSELQSQSNLVCRLLLEKKKKKKKKKNIMKKKNK